ncbi:Ferrous iron transport protein A, putative [hydrothermal vent metagenome]|uniref:Ferrous iron transport protein A, putative n=1 Tax=hydrothermal vent metagenome TaxID=652676 RepID=A0A1W1C5W0_9ZZZZ
MLLSQLKKDMEAKIIKIDADKPLRDRFNSFGIIVGETIVLKRYSLAKQTLEIEVDGTLIVLRADEADKIEVEKI